MKLRLTARSISQSSSLALAVALAMPAIVALPSAAYAQSEQSFNVPAGDLAGALQAFSSQTGMQLVYSSDLVAGKRSSGVSGTLSTQDALQRLLAGTGLSARVSGNSATLVAIGGAGEVAPTDGERVLGAVRVEGSQGDGYFGRAGQAAGVNGINGSRDITATEGTGSYTTGALTIGSKLPQAIKDTPQSVSVMTSELLKKQNVTDLNTAMARAPGIIVAQGDNSLNSTFYSRGFAVTSIQVDGGAPLSMDFGGRKNVAYFPQIDMSQYDHIELLRGAAGTFNGYGDPSGSINLVRKKPLETFQVIGEAQVASWNSYRSVADLTGPIAADGRVRGRMVFTYQTSEHFYETARDDKTLIYAVADADITPTTTLFGGLSYTSQHSVPWQGGLPRYRTGGDLKLPREICLCFSWNKWDFKTTEIFANLDQRIGRDWHISLNATYNRQFSKQVTGLASGAVDPVTKQGLYLTGTPQEFGSKQWLLEAKVSGSFDIFGQRQEVAVGINRSNADGGYYKQYGELAPANYNFPAPNYGRLAINPFNFNPEDYPYPGDSDVWNRAPQQGQQQTVIYANARFTPIKPIHFVTGIRYSKLTTHSNTDILCNSLYASIGICGPAGSVWISSHTNYSDNNFSWPVSTSLLFDVSRNLTAYVGYTDIFQSQADLLDHDLKPLAPIKGSNLEAGIKWQNPTHKLNVSLSAYRIRKNGDGVRASGDYGPYATTRGQAPDNVHSCCYTVQHDYTYLSEGVDFELSGEILPRLQAVASYNYNHNAYEGPATPGEGLPFLTLQPKHSLKIWATYEVPAGKRLNRLAISLGVTAQSSSYTKGYVCMNVDPVEGFCLSDSPPDYLPYEFQESGRAVVDARLDYDVSKNWLLSLNVNNILDKRYYQTTGDVSSGNWYGPPRNFALALRAKW